MTTLTQASREWATRPEDQRFLSLPELARYTAAQRADSRSVAVSNRRLHVEPTGAGDLQVTGPNGHPYAPTHWAFGQLAQRSGAPAGYLRGLPAPLAADCINYGLRFKRDVEDVGVLIRRPRSSSDGGVFAAATGPAYGRIWNADVADLLVDRFGDGVTGDWRVPGEFGRPVPVTTANTTLYAGDRDMFVFLADEERRITVPNRRDGAPGSLARGFFVWNSEVGSATLGAAFFLFDYVCCNRIVWGATQHTELRIRHTSGAPDKWLERVVPVLEDYSRASALPVQEAIKRAQAHRLDADLDAFLATRFSRSLIADLKTTHETEENRPIETTWDVITAATAVARSIPNQDARVDLERRAGELLSLSR